MHQLWIVRFIVPKFSFKIDRKFLIKKSEPQSRKDAEFLPNISLRLSVSAVKKINKTGMIQHEPKINTTADTI